MRGRLPKPNKVREIEGMRGHRPLPKEANHRPGVPDQPQKISPEAQPIWDELVACMDPRILCQTDRRALWQLAEDEAILAEAYSGFWEMTRALKKEAASKGKDLPGGPIMGALMVKNARMAMSSVKDLANRVIIERREFGLTPSARTRIASKNSDSAVDSLELKLCG
jgi:phage terminase small subunit